MTHKQDATFFKAKRTWSKRKDRILGSYLTAYLPKIARLGKPILIVDGFAGPGQFEDGSIGSPLIIQRVIESSAARSSARLLAVEQSPELYDTLRRVLTPYARTEARNSSFADALEYVNQEASRSSVFMYADPFTVRGLDFELMMQVLARVAFGHSVELLLNFNVGVFVRWAQSYSKAMNAHSDSETRRTDGSELDRIAGGTWWRDLCKRESDFCRLQSQFLDHYCNQLRTVFKYVYHHSVYEKSTHKSPKYVLVFCSRHPDAVELMNDEVFKSNDNLEQAEATESPSLFDNSPTLASLRAGDLRKKLLDACSGRMTRGDLIFAIARSNFGQYLRKEIRSEIESALKDGQLISESGKTRINDEERLRRAASS